MLEHDAPTMPSVRRQGAFSRVSCTQSANSKPWIDAEDAQRLQIMLTRLNNSDQSVLRMFFFDGRSYAEISQRLNISINTVGPKLHRAQNRLRQLMQLETDQPAETRDLA